MEGVGAFCFGVLIALASFALGFLRGRLRGRAEEKQRCRSLASQSWQNKGERLSPTARRIYFSIDTDRTELVSVEAFFDGEKST